MRPIGELLVFLREQMTMQKVYQPLVILHLLCQGGYGTRRDIARSLAAGEPGDVDEWEQILMDAPQRALVKKYQILTYNKTSGSFRLNFELSNALAVAEAIAFCETKIWEWIHRALGQGRIDEGEAVRLQAALGWAKGGTAIVHPDPDLEEFALGRVRMALRQRYPQQPIVQQAYGTPGFDLLVGTVTDPVVYVKVVATYGQGTGVELRDVDRRFSVEQGDRFTLAIVHNIELAQDSYGIHWHWGAIRPDTVQLTPLAWCLHLKSQ